MKTIHFIRHGEASHNVGFEKDGEAAYFSKDYINSWLTEKGIKQCKMVQNEFAKNNVKIDIIYTSPLQRTLETTINIFEQYQDVPIIALDELREDNYYHPPNMRETRDEIGKRFPKIVLDRITDKDEWYGKPFPEDRYLKLNKILNATSQSNIAVVSHSKFLLDYFQKIGCARVRIKNCEVITIKTNDLSLIKSKL